MDSKGNILISGASFAGLATAFWMTRLGFKVTVVEIADRLKKGGTPVNIKDNTVQIMKRMGLFEQVQLNKLPMELPKTMNAEGVVVAVGYGQEDTGSGPSTSAEDEDHSLGEEYEIERDVLLDLMFNAVKDDVEIVFGDSFTALTEVENGVEVSFNERAKQTFALVFGCDGVHSAVRKHCFGPEKEFAHFLKAYGSVSVIDKLLVPQNDVHIYTEPGKLVVLSAYSGKTDIILLFHSETEIPFEFRDEEQKRNIVIEKFSGTGWRTRELIQEIKEADNFYFDSLSQIKMPSWSKGRIALVGDAAYCASPAAGRGGSLALDGAAALAEAFQKHDSNFEMALQEYNRSFRPFIEEVQADAESFCAAALAPKTERPS